MIQREVRCRCFDGFSYSSTEINYSAEPCMVSGLMARVADKSSMDSNLSGREETAQDKHRNTSEVGIPYPSFSNSNLDVSGGNGDGEHIQPQISIRIWGYNVKKRAHFVILNADLAVKDRSISLSSDCGGI